MKKYIDIERIKKNYADAFSVGEHIVISEKVDGANSSFTFNSETNKIDAFSRKKLLNEINNLRGFWNWTQLLPKNKIAEITENGRYIIFGEWLVAHSVHYPSERLNQFYMFDVWDNKIEQYLPYETVKKVFEKLIFATEKVKINFVPVFYDGKFTSWEDVYKFVGQTQLGGEFGEGVVVKSQDRLGEKDSRKPYYLKIVADKFSEVHHNKVKTIDPEFLKKKEEEKAFVATVVTERRITKCLEKMIDDNIIKEDWDSKDMKVIARNLPRSVYEDCKKEESEVVIKCENFGKICGNLTMEYVKKLLREKESI